MKDHRKFVFVPLAAAAVALALASVAYACTTIAGSITTTYNGTTCTNSPASCQVHPGNTISSTGSGLTQKSNGFGSSGATNGTTKWSLYFLNFKSTQDGMNTCMSNVPFSEQKLAGPVTQSSTGSVSGSGQIPATAQPTKSTMGPALVCWIDSNSSGVPNYNYATPPTELDVL